MDREGKDTWRFERAGAQAVVITAPGKVAAIVKTSPDGQSPEDVAHLFLDGADVALVEGGRRLGVPKIHVYRAGVSRARPEGEQGLLAVVSDAPLATSVPCLHPEKVREIAALLAAYVRRRRTEEHLCP